MIRNAARIAVATSVVFLSGCQTPPYRPRILSVQTPSGMPAPPPLHGSPKTPLVVPSAPVSPTPGAALAVPVQVAPPTAALVPATPQTTVAPVPPPGAPPAGYAAPGATVVTPKPLPPVNEPPIN